MVGIKLSLRRLRRRYSSGTFFDAKNSKHLIAAAVLLTLVFAVIYSCMSTLAPIHSFQENGTPGQISFMDALYFSVTTETTLGYGDISPLGWARAVACTQVILGLVIAGLAISKITSLPGGRLRTMVQRAAGDWIEFSYVKETLIISLSTIAYTGDLLRYDGDNFDAHGNALGFFRGNLLEVDDSGTFAKFSYSNRDSVTDHFAGGTDDVHFSGLSLKGKWTRLTATCHDYQYGDISYSAVRASEEESATIHDVSQKAEHARRELILRQAREYSRDKGLDL